MMEDPIHRNNRRLLDNSPCRIKGILPRDPMEDHPLHTCPTTVDTDGVVVEEAAAVAGTIRDMVLLHKVHHHLTTIIITPLIRGEDHPEEDPPWDTPKDAACRRTAETGATEAVHPDANPNRASVVTWGNNKSGLATVPATLVNHPTMACPCTRVRDGPESRLLVECADRDRI